MNLVKLLVAALIPSILIVPRISVAEEKSPYPSRPIRVIVPYAPGGGTDAVARLLANSLTAKWGQSVVVENKAGAGGTIGAAEAARSSPDGYTILMGHVTTQAIAPGLMPKLTYKPATDFIPIALVASVPNILLVRAKDGPASLAALVSAIQSKPNGLSYGSSGIGSVQQLGTEMLLKEISGKMVHAPYRGSGQALQGLMAGDIDVLFDTAAAAMPYVQSGRLRALAVTGDSRLDSLPKVPTMTELGKPAVNISAWYGFYAPAGTPDPIIKKWTKDSEDVLRDSAVKKKLADLGAQTSTLTHAEFVSMDVRERDRWSRIVKELGITIE